MDLRFSHFLFAGLFLSISALTPEECQPLITPLNLTDPSVLFGRFYFIMGYTDTDEFNTILKATDSNWMENSASSTNQFIMHQENRIYGSCFGNTVNVTIDGNTMITSAHNGTTTFHLLPTCDGCLVFRVKSVVRNLNKLFDHVNITHNFNEDEVVTKAVYLMGKETTLKDSDLDQFKQQASCLGFSKEPDFVYDPKKEFCKEGEGIHVKID